MTLRQLLKRVKMPVNERFMERKTMANEYNIRLDVRGKSSEFGADSVAELLYLLSTELFRLDVLTTQTKIPNTPKGAEDSIEAAAKRLIEQYYAKFDKANNRSPTLIFRAGREIDLASCYLARMTVDGTVKWLKKHRSFKASESAVGRYWTRFAQLPAVVKIA
jgi:hypothetical protein